MDVTSDEIRSSRFQGTRHVYDRREVDAFLHRAAATLEVYERKLAVTQAHMESLEKALDLANGRARSVRSREARISELESALAAAQHNYESAMSMLQAPGESPEAFDVEDHEVVIEARNRAAVILEKANHEASLIRAEGERIAAEAAEAAAQVAEAAQADADEIRSEAEAEQAAMVAAAEQARVEAQELLDAELEMQRSKALVELDTERARIAGETAEAHADLESRLAKAERKAAKAGKSEEKAQKQLRAAEDRATALEQRAAEIDERAAAAEERAAAAEDRVAGIEERAAAAEERAAAAEERAAAAEADRTLLLAEIERAAAAAEAERKIFMEDAERMFEEAVAAAEADRNARAEQEDNSRADEAAAEIGQLRRQVAQLRTALAEAQERFSKASGMSAAELELAAALVDLDVPDGDVVDLTEPAQEVPETNGISGGEDANVTIKSRWAEMQPMHAAPHAELGSSPGDTNEQVPGVATPTWRDKLAAPTQKGADAEPESDDAAVIGFYERRLAGLRARLENSAPRES